MEQPRQNEACAMHEQQYKVPSVPGVHRCANGHALSDGGAPLMLLEAQEEGPRIPFLFLILSCITQLIISVFQ